jgi:hypothetical protein
MKEYYIGCEGTQQIVVLEEEVGRRINFNVLFYNLVSC